jgi:hypothetical protein
MTTVYDQHDKAFTQVSAFAIVRNGERVANIAFKFPRDGAGRLKVFVHWLGLEMLQGTAGGYGYDKRTAATANAIARAHKAKHALMFAEPGSPPEAFMLALARDAGDSWDAMLRKAGFDVWQVI